MIFAKNSSTSISTNLVKIDSSFEFLFRPVRYFPDYLQQYCIFVRNIVFGAIPNISHLVAREPYLRSDRAYNKPYILSLRRNVAYNLDNINLSNT